LSPLLREGAGAVKGAAMGHQRIFLALTAVIVSTVFCVKATVVPTFDLDGLCAQATLIVVGQVASVQEVGKTTVEFSNRTISAREMVAELRVDHVLKGTTQTTSLLRLHFTIPEEFIGWRSVGRQSYRVFFLTESPRGLMLLSPYYPSLVAVPGTAVEEGSPTERVIAELGGVLESRKALLQERREAVYALDSSKHPEAVSVLRRSGEVDDVGLRLTVTAALVEHNDISTLPFAVDALLKPPSTYPSELVHNVSAAIFLGVKDDRAVPELTRLLRAPGAEARRAGAEALMRTGTKSCIDPLLSAISDSDVQVRFYSAVGLAEITGQMDWRPSMDDFTSNEKKYLQHWREWAKSR